MRLDTFSKGNRTNRDRNDYFFEGLLSLDVFTPLEWSHGVLSVIFGIFRTGIGRGFFWLNKKIKKLIVEQKNVRTKNGY